MMRGVHLLMALLAANLSSCRQDMAVQPSHRPYRPSAYFADGRSARPLVDGTIARGTRSDSGMRELARGDAVRAVEMITALPSHPLDAVLHSANWSFYKDDFPMPITRPILERGQQRFNIYCSVCHDQLGTGKGMIVQRGFTAPPSLHTDWSRGFKLRGIDLKLKAAPIGYYFEVISQGFGAMPDYAEQIGPDDRWAIVAYIRALQLSQYARMDDVADGHEKQRLLDLKGAAP
jgi:hypothetical protein